MSYENTRIAHKPRSLAVGILALLLTCTARLHAQEVPSTEKDQAITASIETGYRWRWFSGNEDLYRSTVNLTKGAKVNAFAVNYKDTDTHKLRFADHASIRSSGWGDEPYGTTNLNVGLADRYDLRVDYHHFDYFNSVPSFANPTAARAGETQSSLDVSRKLFASQLTLRPNASISPFIAFDYDSGRGPGRTNFVQDGNEYTVDTNVDNATGTYRGGVALRFERWSGGLEFGGSTFHDNQHVNVSGPNLGNRATLFLGQRLELDSLEQKYTVSGHDRFARSYAEFRPWRKLSLHGQFSFSQPTVKVGYTDNGSGSFVLLDTLNQYTNELSLTRSNAKYPHPSGSAGAEFRPIERLRIIETVSVDHFNIAGSADTEQTLTPKDSVSELNSTRLQATFTRQRLDAMFDLTSFASLHAGHSYLTATAMSPGSALADAETRSLHRNQADLGLTLRMKTRLKLNVDYQDSRGNAAFFRTDMLQFKKLQARGHYTIRENLQLGLGTTIWNNDNDAADIHFSERSRESTADVTFAPQAGKRISVSASYTRGTVRSNLPFLVPQNYQTELSIYRDRGHNGSLSVVLNPTKRFQARIGGDVFVSTSPLDDGTQTRPTRFYNPRARVLFKFNDAASFVGDWNWHEYSNRAFAREAYQAHLLSTGIEYRF